MSAEQVARATAERLANGSSLTPSDYATLRGHLIGFVRIRFTVIPEADAAEIVDEAVERFLLAATSGREIRPATALAYLRRIVHNAAVDRLRRRRTTGSLIDLEATLASDDDDIARLVDERATADVVERLMAAAARSGDLIAVRVMNDYLRLAESLGESPSTRNVALRAGVSHTTVRNVLARLRESLEKE